MSGLAQNTNPLGNKGGEGVGVGAQGGDFDDLYPDVCVEGLKKDPF